MLPINTIRAGLLQIPGCLTSSPPEPDFRGIDQGVPISQIWTPESNDLVFAATEVDAGIRMEESEASISDFETIPDFDPYIEIGAEVDEKLPLLNGTEGEQIRKSVLLHGMDALGWYSSFHVTGKQWGIYISLTGMAYLITEAFKTLNAPLSTKAHIAFHAILNHELFHFATDYGVAQAELAHQEPWWMPAKTAFKIEKPSYCVIEEKLANAYMLKAFRTMKPALRLRGKQEALKDFTLLQPEGYNEGSQICASDWPEQIQGLAYKYGTCAAKGAQNPFLWDMKSGFDWMAQFPIRPRIDWRYCPIHCVNDESRIGLPSPWLNFFSRLSGIFETENFLGQLEKMTPEVQKAWERTKTKLQIGITPGADFKKWPNEGKNVYSVRVNDNVRAHLMHRQPPGDWLAIEVGSHKVMGHG